MLYDRAVMTPNRTQENAQKGKRRWPRIVLLLAVYGVLLAGGHWGGRWLIEYIGMDPGAETGGYARHIVMAAIVLYTALMAVPFVPGIEISLALLAAFGHKVAIYIYCATIVALVIAYLIGRLVPLRVIAALFRSLGQQRADALVRRLEVLSAPERLETLTALAPSRIVPMLLKYRYIAIAVALNLPGNAVIGGGGGIALLAGISGLFRFPFFLAVVCLAVLPIPLAVFLMGS